MVLEQLEAWELQIQRILLIYDGNRTVPADRHAEIRAMYWTLKLDLRAAMKAGGSEEFLAQITEAERHFLYPAVQAASAHLVARVETSPDEWYQSLCDALSEFSNAAVRLTRHASGR
jgi:hypothetical protein